VLLVGTSFGGFVAERFLASYPGGVRGGVIVGSAARRPSETEIVERYRRLGGDEAARVMRKRLTDPSPDSQREWACVCAPMYRLRPLTRH